MTRTWTASFIGAPAPTDPEVAKRVQPAVYLRRELHIADGLRSATVHVTAIGLIELWLNGQRVGDELLMPGWTEYADRLRVSSFDVTAQLTVGVNALGAIIGEGWAVGSMGYHRQMHVWNDRPLAFVQLELDYGDRIEVVVTDRTWRCSDGAVRENSIYDGENFDARCERHGWNTAGFDDASWEPVEVGEWDLATLMSIDAPPVRAVETLPVREVIRTPAGRTVLDFGQNFSGWVRFTLEAAEGTQIVLHHCEVMIDGEPDFETNRTALTTDRYVHDGGGAATWEPRFTFHGFRYVDIEGWPGEIDPDAFRGVVIHTDMVRTGWFGCSEPMLEKFHENVVWSTRSNFVSLPTDCPQRDERLGWTGDINAFGPTATFLYDVSTLLYSWLDDLVADHRRFGAVPMFAPELFRSDRAPLTALWSDVTVSLPWHLYQHYGDSGVLARQYWSAKDYIDKVEATLLDDRGVISTGFQFGDWVDPDAPPTNAGAGKTSKLLIADLFYIRTTAEMTQIAEVLGEVADAERYRALHRRVLDGFRREWMTPNGRLVNETVSAYALAICFGVFDDEQLPVAGHRLASLVAWGKRTITTGFAGTPYVMPALEKTGYLDLAYRMLLTTECPSVLYPLTMGATTIWERWDAVKPDGSLNSTGMTSLNHYALGAVAQWLHETVLGIRRTALAWSAVRIAPRPGGGLTHATGAHDSPKGRIEVSWSVDGDEMIVDVSIPEGVTATVVLPDHPGGDVHDVVGGRHAWRYRRVSALLAGYTLDTPIKVLAADPVVWPLLVEAVSRHRGEETPFGRFDDILVKSSPREYLSPLTPSPEFEAALLAAVEGRPVV